MSGVAVWVCLMMAAACGTTTVPTPIPRLPTLPPLTSGATFWDMGIAILFPAGWIPFYGTRQLLIAPSADATRQNPPKTPLISLQYGTLEQLGLEKTATLQQIARVVSGASRDSTLIAESQATFAGLDAFSVAIQETTNSLLEQTIAFRMPDGRIGWLIGLAPTELWANFAPPLDSIRATGKLLRPSDYLVPSTVRQVYFSEGDMTLTLPDGWVEQPVTKDARLYHALAELTYQDSSGVANGPQIVASVFQKAPGQSASDVLRQTLGINPLRIKVSELTVAGQPAALYVTTEQSTGQTMIFVAVSHSTRSSVTIFRWTTPAPLVDVTRPILDAFLRGASFGR